MWRRSGSGWPRTLLDNVPLWLLQHSLQNPQAGENHKKNNEGNGGDTGGYYAEHKVVLKGLKDRLGEGGSGEVAVSQLSLMGDNSCLPGKPVVLTVPASPGHCRGMDRDARVLEGGLGQ